MDVIGVDLGGSSIKIARLRDGQLAPLGRIPHKARGLEPVARAAAEAILGLTSRDASLPVGLCVAGLVRGGVVARSGNLELVDAPLREEVERLVDRRLAVFLSDARATGLAAVGEEDDEPVRLALALGTGVGGALVVARAVVADEGFGHAEVTPEEAPTPCALGHRRCLEAFLGARGLAALAERAGLAERTGADLDRSPDPRAQRLLGEVGRTLGRAARGLVAARGFGKRPQLLVLSGGTASARVIVQGASSEFGRVVLGRSGPFTAAHGAALAALPPGRPQLPST